MRKPFRLRKVYRAARAGPIYGPRTSYLPGTTFTSALAQSPCDGNHGSKNRSKSGGCNALVNSSLAFQYGRGGASLVWANPERIGRIGEMRLGSSRLTRMPRTAWPRGRSRARSGRHKRWRPRRKINRGSRCRRPTIFRRIPPIHRCSSWAQAVAAWIPRGPAVTAVVTCLAHAALARTAVGRATATAASFKVTSGFAPSISCGGLRAPNFHLC